jgi:hypothetical protein
MSRYEYLPRHWPSHMSFAVGWDPAMHSFFAQVMDYSISRDDDCVVIWLGALRPHYADIDAMMQALNRRILGRLHPVVLGETTRRRLIRDRERSLRPSRHRRRREPLCALDLLGGRPLADGEER